MRIRDCLLRLASSTGTVTAQMSDIHLTHCKLCGTACSGAAGLLHHYRASPKHPNCPRCEMGFYDRSDLETVRVLSFRGGHGSN